MKLSRETSKKLIRSSLAAMLLFAAAEVRAQEPLEKRVAALIKQLEGSSGQEFGEAFDALAALGPEGAAAAPLLIEAMAVDNRGNALAVALGKMGPAVEPLLRKGLLDEREAVRTEIAYAFIVIDEAVVVNAIDDLRRALQASGPEATGWLAMSIGRLGEAGLPAVPEIIEAARHGGLSSGYVAGALGDIGVGALPQVLAALQHQNAEVRSTVSMSLRKLAPKAPDESIPPLIAALLDDSPKVRANAAYALGAVGNTVESAVPSLLGPLVAALQDETPSVRGRAAFALGEIGSASASAVPSLLQLLDDRSFDVSRWVPEALAKIAPEDPNVISGLAAMIESTDKWQPFMAIRALGSIGPLARDAVPALLAALDQEEMEMTIEAAMALSAVAPEDEAVFRELLDAFDLWGNLWARLRNAILSYELPPNIAAMAVAEKLVEAEVIIAPPPQTTAEAVKLMEATLTVNLNSGEIKRFVLLWLGKIGTREAVAAISAFETWAETERKKHAEPPLIIHPGSVHYGSHPNEQEPWLTCQDSAGQTWELYKDNRYAGFFAPVYRVARKDSDEPPVWVGGMDLGKETYLEIMRSKQYSLEMPEPGLLRLHLREHAFDFEVREQAKDTDQDGLPDVIERALTTDPTHPDSDGDGITDFKDGNPLTARQTSINDEQEIRQALFTYLWATSNASDTVLVHLQDQEFYGYPGIVLPAGENRKSFATISFNKIEFTSDSEATAHVSDYMGPEAGSWSAAILRKRHGKWVVVKFNMLGIS